VSRRVRLGLVGTIYLVLLAASHVVQFQAGSLWTPPPEQIGAETIEIPSPRASGPDPSRSIRLSFLARGPESLSRPPIILLHGSPGQASDFAFQRHPDVPSFMDRLAAQGRRVYAVDLPGFGNSQPWIADYSSRAYAHAIISMLDVLEIDRAHLVCWSNSGAVGINLCDIAPDRMASLTMLASVGAQETEGSGSYYFEHAKYLVGLPIVVALPELIPHFGLLGPTSLRHAFIRSFLDNDQRPLAGIMATTRVPTLILHGRHDFLVADWAAEYHHAIMPSSRLVMLDASHFLPFLQPEQTARYILEHVERHDTPGIEPITTYEDHAPRRSLPGLAGAVERLGVHVRSWHWWILLPFLALTAWWKPETGTIAAAILVAQGDLDFGVAYAGLLAGRLWRGPELPDQQRSLPWIVIQIAWNLIALSVGMLVASLGEPLARSMGGFGIIPLFVFGVLLLRLIRHSCTWTGRRRIAAALARLANHEWWPAWVIYLPVIVRLPALAARNRGLLAFTACNPGIENGGGFVGESKMRILESFPDDEPTILHAHRIERAAPDRAVRALALIEEDAALGGFPVVLKPDVGQRGAQVTLVHNADDVRAFFAQCDADAMVQRFHPGPCECGVFWMRKDAELDNRPVDQRDGFIYAITIKCFQSIEGDGTNTIRRLIWAHPRFRCQARLLLDRFRDRLDEVLPEGQELPVSFAGNHAQGTRFADGAHLLSPALEAEINRIARRFADDGFDYGRFDLRYESDELLREGRGFAIIEVNGTTSEATNLYDPNRSIFWAWSILLGQWKHAYRIGRERILQGSKPLSTGRFLRMLLSP